MRLALLLLLTLWTLATAAPVPDVWTAAKSRLQAATDYQVSYEYTTPAGVTKVEYACVRTPNPSIRTAILQGHNYGALVLYRPEVDRLNVHIRKGSWSGIRPIDSYGFPDTPYIVSLWDMMVQAAGDDPPEVRGTETISGHPCSVLGFSTGHELAVSQATFDILRWRRPSPKDEWLLYNWRVNSRPRIDF